MNTCVHIYVSYVFVFLHRWWIVIAEAYLEPFQTFMRAFLIKIVNSKRLNVASYFYKKIDHRYFYRVLHTPLDFDWLLKRFVRTTHRCISFFHFPLSRKARWMQSTRRCKLPWMYSFCLVNFHYNHLIYC